MSHPLRLGVRLLGVVWGRRTGWVSLPARQGDRWIEQWFEWPKEARAIVEWIVEANRRGDVYWSPLVYPEPSRKAALKARSSWAWAELDEVADPDPKPTVLWETSPGRYQGLYRLSRELPASELQTVNHRLAWATGADPSGWDAGQVLRVPGTRNWKYARRPRGRLIYANGPRYEPDAFERLPAPPAAEVTLENKPDYEQTLAEYRDVLPAKALRLLETPPEEVRVGERSDRLWLLIRLLVEAGLPDEAVYSLAQGSVWNKFRGRADEHTRLVAEISKAKAKVPTVEIEDPPAEELPPEVKPSELWLLPRTADDWLTDYIEASRQYVPGAPYVYHLAAGLALLATAVGPIQGIRFGLARSTYILVVGPSRSGKSRTQQFAQKVLAKCSFIEQIGILHRWSPEGLLRALADAPTSQVLVIADEARALFAAAKRKDYMVDSLDLLNELYNVPYYRKQLSKSGVEVKNPCVVYYGLSTPEGFKQALSHSDMATGFLARFLVFYDPDAKPQPYELTPPGESAAVERLAQRLSEIRRRVMDPPETAIYAGKTMVARVTGRFNVGFPQSALEELNAQMSAIHEKHSDRAELAPLLAEIGQQGVKIAVLRAIASEPDFYLGGVDITAQDVRDAMKLLEKQLGSTQELFEGLGETRVDRAIRAITQFLSQQPKMEATRTEIQRKFGYLVGTKSQMDEIEETMLDRGLIEVRIETAPRNRRRRKVYRLIARRRR